MMDSKSHHIRGPEEPKEVSAPVVTSEAVSVAQTPEPTVTPQGHTKEENLAYLIKAATPAAAWLTTSLVPTSAGYQLGEALRAAVERMKQ